MTHQPSRPNAAIGELLWDLFPTGARLGGAIANYAMVSARLGAHSVLVSCLGDDELGDEAKDRLRQLSLDADSQAKPAIDLSHLQISHSLPTGSVAVTLDKEGRARYEIRTPAAWDAIQPSPELFELASNASVICFGTLAQRGAISRDSIQRFIEAARPDCVRVCDLNLRKPFCTSEVLRWSCAHADVLKVSDEELPEVGRLLDEPVLAAALPNGPIEIAAKAAEALLQFAPQCRLVAITLGPHGSLLADRSGMYRHAGYRVKLVDTIGAGDAFTGGMVHAYMRQASLQQISDVANQCGSYVASQSGATPEFPEQVLQSIREILAATP